MAKSMVEKYEQILSADPGSMVFVELARALVERGEAARAVQVCDRGLEHHPRSVQGRVARGRALLALGRTADALDELGRATALDSENPYAFNLVGEILLEARQFAAALPVLRRAALLQPGDLRIRGWLETAQREVNLAAPDASAAASVIPGTASGGGVSDTTDTTDTSSPAGSAPPPAPPPGMSAPAGPAVGAPAAAAPPPAPPPGMPTPAGPAVGTPGALGEGVRADLSAGADAAGRLEEKRETSPVPPPLPPPLPRPPARKAPGAEPATTPEVQHAATLAAQYEAELRQKLAAERPAPGGGGFWARHRVGTIVASLSVVALVAGWIAWGWVRAETRDEEIAAGIARARVGLARDTRVALRAGVEALDEVLELDPQHVAARALRAQAKATLATVYGEGDLEEARRLVEAADPEAEPGAVLAARRLLARDREERRAVDDAILARAPGGDPDLDSLAGVVLLSRGQVELAIARFNAAIAAGAGHVPTFVRVGDYYRSRGGHGDALRYYALALAVAEDHPGAILGSAESLLATQAPPARLRETLTRLDRLLSGGDFPRGERARLALLRSRFLSALDDRASALAALDGVEGWLDPGDRDGLVALAEALAEAGAHDRAHDLLRPRADAADADGKIREALARVLLSLERYREVTELPAGPEERSLHLWKGVAWLRLGNPNQARAELRSTAVPPENKLLADAVAYLALADLAAGDVERARTNLENVGSGPRARPTGRWALGNYLVARGRLDDAQKAFEEALAAEPRHLEARCALGRLLLSRGRPTDAIEHLSRAVAANPFHREAVLALGLARLEAGEVGPAREALKALRERSPDDAGVAGALALASLRDGDLAAAEAALRPVEKSRDPLVLRARGEWALASGDAAGAVSWLTTAAKARPEAAVQVALGEAHLLRGDGPAALAAFGGARRYAPESWGARLGRARAQLVLGRSTRAEAELLELLAQLPPEAPASLRAGANAALAEALLRRPRERERALGAAREAVRLDPRSAAAQLALGRVLAEKGEGAEAAPYFARAADLAPRDPRVHLARGTFLATRPDGRDEAHRSLRRVVDLAPKTPVARQAEQALRRLKP
jgi:tetratricopeptide (TPR) repeat protein